MFRRIALYLLTAFLLTLSLSASALAQGEKKVAYGILIDNTGSLRTQFYQVIMISKAIVERTHQRGPISLFNFKTEGDTRNSFAVITEGTEWSQNRAVLDNYIDTLFVVPGRTTLRDAIDAISVQLNTQVNLDKDAFGDKTIVLITDGEDRVSKIKEKQLIQSLKESGIKVYAVGLIEALDREGGLINKAPRAKAEAFLERITKGTGGRVVFPKPKTNDVDSMLNELFKE